MERLEGEQRRALVRAALVRLTRRQRAGPHAPDRRRASVRRGGANPRHHREQRQGALPPRGAAAPGVAGRGSGMRGAWSARRWRAVLSERRSGELAPDAERALEAHLAGVCPLPARRPGPRGDAGVAGAAAGGEPGGARRRSLPAASARPRPGRAPSRWGVRAVLVAAAAAALLTRVHPPHVHQPPHGRPALRRSRRALPSDELFAEDVFLDDDLTDDGATLDALSLEGPGIFGNLDG